MVYPRAALKVDLSAAWKAVLRAGMWAGATAASRAGQRAACLAYHSAEPTDKSTVAH